MHEVPDLYVFGTPLHVGRYETCLKNKSEHFFVGPHPEVLSLLRGSTPGESNISVCRWGVL